jgi:hypothetical protein
VRNHQNSTQQKKELNIIVQYNDLQVNYNSTVDRFRPLRAHQYRLGVSTFYECMFKYDLTYTWTANHHHAFNLLVHLHRTLISAAFSASLKFGSAIAVENVLLRCDGWAMSRNRVHLGNVTERRGNFTYAHKGTNPT